MNHFRPGGHLQKEKVRLLSGSRRRFSPWISSGVTRFHVSALCQALSRAANRRTDSLVRHEHHSSNEVEVNLETRH